jgi:hypothetical protein
VSCNLHENDNQILRFAQVFKRENRKFASQTCGIGFAQNKSDECPMIFG